MQLCLCRFDPTASVSVSLVQKFSACLYAMLSTEIFARVTDEMPVHTFTDRILLPTVHGQFESPPNGMQNEPCLRAHAARVRTTLVHHELARKINCLTVESCVDISERPCSHSAVFCSSAHNLHNGVHSGSDLVPVQLFRFPC